MFPVAMSAPPPVCDELVGKPLTAVAVLRRFNAPGGLASTMAQDQRRYSSQRGRAHIRAHLVDRFTVLYTLAPPSAALATSLTANRP